MRTFLAGIFICAVALSSHADWKKLTSISGSFESVHFINTYTGWVSGDQGLVKKTTDGGKKWVKQTTNTTSLLTSIYFIDELYGWAVGSAGVIITTTNGGDSWSPQISGVTYQLEGVQFLDRKNGFIVGGGSTSNATFLTTTNGGANWAAPLPTVGAGDIANFGVHFVNQDTGIMASYAGIFRTTNRGAQWIPSSDNAADMFHVDFYDNLTGISTGNFTAIYRTTDGGITWIRIPYGTAAYALFDVSLVDEKYGWIVGGLALLKTTDAGMNWVADGGVLSNNTEVSFVNRGRGWVVGTDMEEYSDPTFVISSSTLSLTVDGSVFPHDTTLTISNTGGDTLHIKLTLNDSVFSVTSAKTFALKAGDSKQVTIHFAPQTAGADTAQLIVESEAPVVFVNVQSTGVIGVHDVKASEQLFSLEENYPNPFSRLSVVGYRLSVDTQVELSVFDMFGRKVKTLEEGYKLAGAYSVDVRMDGMPAGVYSYQLRMPGKVLSKKMIVM